MNSVQIDQKSSGGHRREGFSIAHFLTVADVERSARYLRKGLRGSHSYHG